ncbi:MAG TPA: sodium:proton antiporter [Campylobacterales bacterium]|nr:sodium:proton antiporter [Campylobacterales bacterium]HHH51193.1 sodium:proton antiporter [Campylobacterales bacterium]
MFNFAITSLGNLFFGLSLVVFISLWFIKREDILLQTLLLSSLGIIFYANDLITLFIGWEIMSWSSYLIISKKASLETSQKYIIFNLGAGFALLGAIVIIYSFVGSFLYSEIVFNEIPVSFRKPIYILLLITIFIKSAIMPFHYWVVDTYEESDNIFSAILSAIISKAGIFLFITLFIKIIGYKYLQTNLFDIVAWLGVITSIVATIKAISQDSMKRLLAYSSIAQVGYIVTVLAILNSSGLEAGLYHTIIHTFVKLLLFVNIASIIYITGKTKFSELGGLLYEYPTLFILLVIGIIGLAGMPPLAGFNSKFLIYTTLLEQKKALLLVAVMFSSATAFLYCYKLVYGIYLGQPTHSKESYQKLPNSYYIAQIIGALVLIVLAIFPSLVIEEFNTILISLGFKPTDFKSLFELNGRFASFNGGVIMSVFISIFVVILLIAYKLKNKTRKVKDRLDISYCGETPNPNINLHYGYGLGKELSRIGFIKMVLNNSTQKYWEQIKTITQDSSLLIKQFYNMSIQNIGLIIILFFTILLLRGVQ